MRPEERDSFLRQPLTCFLSCLDDTGHPYVVPVWFTHADGGFWVIPRARAAWAGYLERDGRVSLCIDGGSYMRGARVLVRGVAELVERPNVGGRWYPIAREMSVRYNGEERGLAYIEKTAGEPRWLFFVRPESITEWTGGWAAKYKHANW